MSKGCYPGNRLDALELRGEMGESAQHSSRGLREEGCWSCLEGLVVVP